MTATSRPTACNIGPAELARRRRSAIWATAALVIAAAALVVVGVPPIARLAILPLSAAAAVTWLQVTRRFCVAFGAIGVRNFGPLGTVDRIVDPAERATERRIAVRMILEGLLYGAVVAVGLALLPA